MNNASLLIKEKYLPSGNVGEGRGDCLTNSKFRKTKHGKHRKTGL